MNISTAKALYSNLNSIGTKLAKVTKPVMEEVTEVPVGNIGSLSKDTTLFSFKKSANLTNGLKDVVHAPYIGPRLNIRVSKPKLPSEIGKIRNGKTGVIRSAKELTTADIERLIAYQREGFSPRDISKLIASFPKEEQELATKLLSRLTQFGNYSSMEKIVQQIETLYYDSSVNIGSTIRYLAKHEGAFAKRPKFAESKATCIVDELLLQKLETDSNYLKELLGKELDFVIPEGFSTGVNPFNQTMNVKELLSKNMKLFKELKAKHPNKSDDEIISELLNQPIIQRLERLGIKDCKVISSTPSMNAEGIAEQLNGKHISAEQIERILAKHPENERQYILEVLAQSLSVPNSKEIGKRMQVLHKALIKHNGGSDKGVYYIIPQDVKSYSLVTMQYQLTNGVHSSRIITLEELSKHIPEDAKSLVVLDDLAGSGESLQTAFTSIYQYLPKEQQQIKDVFLMPMLSTKKAFEMLNKEGLGNVRATCIPSEIVEGIQSKEYWTSLCEEDRKMLSKILDGCGYGGDNLCVSLPYMGPDNNCAIFSKYFAKLFTLNGSGIKCGAKGKVPPKEPTVKASKTLDMSA